MSWQTALIPGSASDGKPILSLIAKRTYMISTERLRVSLQQLPLCSADITSDPQNQLSSETLAESDLIAFKHKTDVVVLSKAYTPEGKRAYSINCEVDIGQIHKIISVFGDRRIESKLIRGLQFSDPVPFESKDLGYMHSYGGEFKTNDGLILHYPPNPIGKGFCLKITKKMFTEIDVPTCEDPEHPLKPSDLIIDKYRNWSWAPKPVSFGWTKTSFFPRYTYAITGTNSRTESNVHQIDFRFFQGASDGMCDHVLVGNEHVKLKFMDPKHPIFEFDLPGDRPVLLLSLDGEELELEPILHTVLIDKEKGTVSMVWRGFREYAGTEELKKMKINYKCKN